MSTTERRLTPRELGLLATLGPHFRSHVLSLLDRHSGVTLTSTRGTPVDRRPLPRCGETRATEDRSATFVGSLPVLQDLARIAWNDKIGRTCSGPFFVELDRSGKVGQQLRIGW